MVGCSAAIATMAGGVRFTAFGSTRAAADQDILITIFLRGGMDGLSVVMPISGADHGYYTSQRPDLAVPIGGTVKAINLDDRVRSAPGRPRHSTSLSGKKVCDCSRRRLE